METRNWEVREKEKKKEQNVIISIRRQEVVKTLLTAESECWMYRRKNPLFVIAEFCCSYNNNILSMSRYQYGFEH